MIEEPKFDTSQVEELAAAETGEALILKPSAELLNVEQPKPPVDIEELFFQLNATVREIEDRARFIDETIQTLAEKRKELIKDLVAECAELENSIEAEILKQGKSYKCQWGAATHRKGRTTISWNDDALKGYAVEHADILKFRTEKTGEPSVTLKVGSQV